MSVSKRMRFEVLRRDNHTCRYCGRSAPQVKLTIDHVIPEALGGQDVPENLVAACEDCNSGKTSIAPGSPLVDDVRQEAVRWTAALREAARLRRAERQKLLAIGDHFVSEIWERFYFGESEETGEHAPLPADWREAVERFWATDLPWEDVDSAVRLAMGNTNVLIDDKFRYFCGVCWRMVSEMQETALQIVDTYEEPAPAAPRPPKEPPMPRDVSQAMVRQAIQDAASKALREKHQA